MQRRRWHIGPGLKLELHRCKAEHTKTLYMALAYTYIYITVFFPSEIAYTGSTSPIQSETVSDLYKSYM
jgi:hypothetical protein